MFKTISLLALMFSSLAYGSDFISVLEAECHNTAKNIPAELDRIEIRHTPYAPVMVDNLINVALVIRLNPEDMALCEKHRGHPSLIEQEGKCLHKTESPLSWDENKSNGTSNITFKNEFAQEFDGKRFNIFEEVWIEPETQTQIKQGESFIAKYQVGVIKDGKRSVKNKFNYQCLATDVER